MMNENNYQRLFDSFTKYLSRKYNLDEYLANRKKVIKEKGKIDIPIERLFQFLYLAIILFWFSVTIFGTFVKEDLNNDENLPSIINQLQEISYEEFPDAEEILIEPRYGDNVRIYLDKQAYENVPFPLRDDVIQRISKVWFNRCYCWFLPVLSIRDIKTGDELDSYSWLLGT